MKTLAEVIESLTKRVEHLEKYLGLPPSEKEKKTWTPRKNHKVAKVKHLRRHANKQEGEQSRREIVAFLKTRKKPVHKASIGRKVRVTSEGALGWYLRDLRKAGSVKMSKRGFYQYIETPKNTKTK